MPDDSNVVQNPDANPNSTGSDNSDQSTGQVSLPNGGQITSSTPTPQETAVTPAPIQPTQTPTTGAVQPGSVPNAPVSQTPIQPLNAEVPQPKTPAPPSPAEQRASGLYKLGELLTGGKQYNTTIDPVTGSTVKTPVPVSGKHLALALAMEALGGSIAGLGAPAGVNHLGNAAKAGYDQANREM